MNEPIGLGRSLLGRFRRTRSNRSEETGEKGDGDRVARYWAEMARGRAEKGSAPRGCPWTDSSLIQKFYIHPTISGTQEANWLIWIKDNYFVEPAERALNIGCGDGCLERHGATIHLFKACDALDISPGAIAVAKCLAEKSCLGRGINYQVADSNTVRLKQDWYDVIFSAMALHHIANLEGLFEQIDASLIENGLLILNEYVGPNRFQWTDAQLEIANDLLLLLPERYRVDPTTHTVKEAIRRQPLEHMIAIDPSEAVRSRDILPLVEERFTIVKRIDYGGTILNLLLDNIILNFDEDRAGDMAMLRALFSLEKLLIRKGILESDFSLIVARKRTR